MGAFRQQLAFGKIAESQIASWLRSRGNTVLPVYEVEMDTGKGPQLFLPDEELIAPDLFVFKFSYDDGQEAWWTEAKHKSVFSWHRITGRWTTGVDLRHYHDYLRVDELTPWPVWLLFLHSKDRCDRRNEPWPCPTGLFGRPLEYLREHENHRSQPRNNGTGWGRTGMVYWAYDDLMLLATLDDVCAASCVAVSV